MIAADQRSGSDRRSLSLSISLTLSLTLCDLNLTIFPSIPWLVSGRRSEPITILEIQLYTSCRRQCTVSPPVFIGAVRTMLYTVTQLGWCHTDVAHHTLVLTCTALTWQITTTNHMWASLLSPQHTSHHSIAPCITVAIKYTFTRDLCFYAVMLLTD